MFGHRTPVKSGKTAPLESKSPKEEATLKEKAGPSKDTKSTSVRLSVGEFESKIRTSISPKATASTSGHPEKLQVKAAAASTSGMQKKTGVLAVDGLQKGPEYSSRGVEAKAWAMKARLQINNSRNLKNEIKMEVLEAVDRLNRLVRDAEEGKPYNGKEGVKADKGKKEEVGKKQENVDSRDGNLQQEMIQKIEEHSLLLRKNTEEMEKLKESIRKHQEVSEEKGTYARVAAGPARLQQAVHSVVITSTDDSDSSEQVIQRIRTAVNAREVGLRIENVRKAKDGKVILGCRTREELGKVKDRLRTSGEVLQVEDIKNKDPLVILRDVLQYHSDGEILDALRAQNKHLFRGLSEEEDRMLVKFRRKTRNVLMNHVVLVVSPPLWNRMTREGTVCVDLQTVKVADQSPLVQCSRCLGYGHGKRFCRDPVDLCSHCGGPHLKSECAEWLARALPTCCNCQRASHVETGHNAFSSECPVRKRWETLARSTVAYC